MTDKHSAVGGKRGVGIENGIIRTVNTGEIDHGRDGDRFPQQVGAIGNYDNGAGQAV